MKSVMKKVSVLLAVVMLVGVLAVSLIACGGVKGIYTLDSIETKMMGITVTIDLKDMESETADNELVKDLFSMYKDVSIELSDEEMILKAPNEETETVKYKIEDSKIIILDDEGKPSQDGFDSFGSMTVKNGKMYFEIDYSEMTAPGDYVRIVLKK